MIYLLKVGKIAYLLMMYECMVIWEASGQAQCLKIKEKVLFNIASEASYYVYILCGQKFIKHAKKLASFWKPNYCGQTVLPDWSIQMDKNW